MSQQGETEPDATDYDVTDSLAAYKDYNSSLRTWFITFGVGCLAALLTNQDLQKALHSSGRLRLVAGLLIGAVASQIVIALINKVTNWYVYMSGIKVGYAERWDVKAALWLVEQGWLDFLLDFATLALYVATVWILATTLT